MESTSNINSCGVSINVFPDRLRDTQTPEGYAPSAGPDKGRGRLAA